MGISQSDSYTVHFGLKVSMILNVSPPRITHTHIKRFTLEVFMSVPIPVDLCKTG